MLKVLFLIPYLSVWDFFLINTQIFFYIIIYTYFYKRNKKTFLSPLNFNKMKLTKDEARILGEAMEQYKYQVASNITLKDLGVFTKLHVLQQKLETFGNDKRRNGRTSEDSWFDLMVRFCKTNKK